jgi:LysR family hydrogen peroxide-inducible transcriptional activator
MSFAGLSLRDLEYVVAVAEHGSFIKAADTCRVSQPSLSIQIGKLEARLNTVIFERTTRRVLMTNDGCRIVDQMRKVLSEARNLIELAHRADTPFGGTLRLSAIATLGPYLFPRILNRLRADYPGLTLILGEGRTDDLVGALSHGELDAVLISTSGRGVAVTEAAVFHEPFVLACPEGHPAGKPDGGGWQGLAPGERLLLEDGHCLREQAIAGCDDVDISCRHATSLETLKHMVASGQGCTLVPALAVADVEGVQYLTLSSAVFSRTIGLAWRRSDPRMSQFEELANRLRAIVSSTCNTIRLAS